MSVSSGVPNTEKQMKARWSRRSDFIVSKCLERLMRHEVRVLEIASPSNNKKTNSSIILCVFCLELIFIMCRFIVISLKMLHKNSLLVLWICWLRNVIQFTSDFHLCFHWISTCIHAWALTVGSLWRLVARVRGKPHTFLI